MEMSNQPDDSPENQSQEPTPVCVLPEELKARLEKADGHINAAGRKLPRVNFPVIGTIGHAGEPNIA